MTTTATHPPTFTRWLKRQRAQYDLTQEALAELAFCSVQAIRAFEAGSRRPSVAMAERLADVLHIPVAAREEFVRLARTPLATEAAESKPAPTLPVTPAPPVAPPVSLPTVATPFIGRAAELHDLRRLVGEEGQRLVTIVGPGGMGKTRLALDLTATLADHFADGAAFVPLAAINQPQHLPSALASTLNIPLQGATDLWQQVNTWFAPRQLLLTLDNVEQLLGYEEMVTWVSQLLATAPRLHLLVTSRERLRVSGERIFELTGLPLPAPNQPVEQADAAILFLERAQQADHEFVLHPQNQAAISRICHLVEGMPLGIELAAAWVRVLTPEEIADEISRSVDFLTLSARDMTPRHRSMRAVFDHSWKLLSEEERSVFMKLSVFRGGCTREAAQQVTGATLPLLASLIDKSLLRRSQSTPTRYTMHELVRQYAADQLQAAPNNAAVAVADAHAAYYHQLVREAELQIWGANIAEVVSRLETENDNVRAALEHYLTHPAGVEQSINLAGSLWRFWEIRGYITEGRTWLARALQRGREPPASWRWLALHAAGNLAGDQGDYAAARRHYEESLHLLQTQLPTLTDPEARQTVRYRIANTLTNLGYSALSQNELAQALAFSEEALALHRQLNIKVGLGLTTTNLAKIKLLQQQLEQATHFGEESLAIYRELGDERGLGWNLTTLGAIARERGAYGRAAELYQEAGLLFDKLADQADRVELSFEWGELAAVQGDDRQAAAHYQAGLTLAQALGDKKNTALLLDRLSMVACRAGDYAQATTLSEQSIDLYRTLDNRLGLSEALHHRGDIAAAQTNTEAAKQYYAASRRLKAQTSLYA